MLRKGVGGFVLVVLLAVADGLVDTFEDALNHTDVPAVPSSRTGRNLKNSDLCVTNEGFSGNCMSRFSCMRQGGSVSGFCGTYGVCCETNLLCGASSKQKRISIKNPAVLPSTGACNYIIEPHSSSVCQLRIDFEKFSLRQPQPQPSTNGAVECSDRFVVHNVILGGSNDKQHIYLPFSVAAGNDLVQLRFELPDRWAGTSWRLAVTQLECPAPRRRSLFSAANPFLGHNSLTDLRTIFSAQNSDLDLLAPPGCLQYFTARTGAIKSFNFNGGAGPYLPEMSYAVCFKRALSDAMVQFTTVDFELAQQRDPDLYPGYDEECHGTVVTAMRKEDYLMIPRAMMVPAATYQPTYFCGTALKKGDTILSATEGPFVVYFNSDSMTDDSDKGFHFQYQIQ